MKYSHTSFLLATIVSCIFVRVTCEDKIEANKDASCLQRAEICREDKDCCTGLGCTNDQCWKPCEYGASCASDSACCGPYSSCYNGRCTPVCFDEGNKCNSTNHCCTGSCVNGICKGDTCMNEGDNCHPLLAPCCDQLACSNRTCVDFCNNQCDVKENCCPGDYCSLSKNCKECSSMGYRCTSPEGCCFEEDYQSFFGPENFCVKGFCRLPCLSEGNLCTSDVQCCSVRCDSGVCKKSCLGVPKPCKKATDCCSGICGKNKMCESPKPCQDLRAACSANSDCCLHYCANGKCQLPCKKIASTCSSNDDCCDTALCIRGVCSNVPCLKVGSTCKVNENCCGNFCRNNTCVLPCLAAGEKCSSNDQCCNQQCQDGACQSSCVLSGGPCFFDNECCDGFCSAYSRCMYKCSLANGTCVYQEDCCYTNSCVKGRCGKDCYPSSSECTYDRDCCSNICLNGFCECY